jgi:hypothetical protein
MSVTDIDTAGIDVITAVNGHDLAPAARPYWQDRPCPHWCLMAAPHKDSDMLSDRYHMSVFHHIDLTLEEPITSRSAADEDLSCEPAFLMASLYQEYRWRDPQVVLCHDGTTDIPFTIAEAGSLVQALTAHAGMDPARGAECPPWCHEHHTEQHVIDRVHVSDHTMVTLALGEHDSETQEPESVGIRLWQKWLDRDPSVDIRYRDEYMSLTFAEARELADSLAELVRWVAEPA